MKNLQEKLQLVLKHLDTSDFEYLADNTFVGPRCNALFFTKIIRHPRTQKVILDTGVMFMPDGRLYIRIDSKWEQFIIHPLQFPGVDPAEYILNEALVVEISKNLVFSSDGEKWTMK